MSGAHARQGPQIVLVRHGETAWSLSGQHTGLTDVPLTVNGSRDARRVGRVLSSLKFEAVLSSPLERARRTCELAGLGHQMQIEPDLAEWNYGRYEGLTPDEIRATAPDWMIFCDGCPEGESPEQIGARVDRVIAKLRALDADVALFGHGHVLRVLAARWLGLPAHGGCHFSLDPATLSILGYYRGQPAVKRWNGPVNPGGDDR